jgi:hypothetical protein
LYDEMVVPHLVAGMKEPGDPLRLRVNTREIVAFMCIGCTIQSCQIIRRYAEGTADRDWQVRQWLESAQTGQNGGFAPLALLSLPSCGAPGSANYAAAGISGGRRMSPTDMTRSVIPRAMAGVRSRYLPFKPGIGSRNDSCGRAK